MTKLKKHELRTYVSYPEFKYIEKESAARKNSISKTVRDCLLEYMNLREELATAINHPGKAGDEHTGTVIHTLLSRTEERIAALFDQQSKQINALKNQVYTLTAMIDRMYLGVMQHLPEVPEKLASGAVAGAKRRHKKWLEAIQRLLAESEETV